MLNDRTAVLALVGRLLDEEIEADVQLRGGAAEVLLRPSASVAKLTEILGEQSFDMTYDGVNLLVIDRSNDLPEVTAPLGEMETA